MQRVYFLADKSYSDCAVATPEDRSLISRESAPELRNVDRVPFDLYLKSVTRKGSTFLYHDDLSGLRKIWQDLCPNIMAWNVMSSEMRSVIESNYKGRESIAWMSIDVKSKDESRVYHVPRFTELPDVLDYERTDFVKGTDIVIKPVFSATKISNYSVFCLPGIGWEIPSGLYVSDQLKSAIEESGLTGVEFEDALVS